MVWLILATTGASILGASLVARLTGRIGPRTFMACCSITNACSLIACVAIGQTVIASFTAGGLGLSLWLWWNGGGGDGTKRRLRSWRRAFRGVRRTAPAGSAS